MQKLVWDSSKITLYNDSLCNNCEMLNDIVSQITCSNISITEGINNFGNVLYNVASNVIGVNKCVTIDPLKSSKKYESPWFTDDCFTARNDLKRANKAYRNIRTHENYCLVIDKRRFYRKTKRKAKSLYARKQRLQLNTAAKSDPKKFWNLVKKYKKKL